jgi:hypothetical protein
LPFGHLDLHNIWISFSIAGQDELIADTILELCEEFGAVCCESQTIRGIWMHEADIYRDELTRVFVDTPDTDRSREFFVAFKLDSKPDSTNSTFG